MRSRSTRTNFYPRPPRGGRPCASRPRPRRDCISIHALREEGDEPNRKGVSTMKIFLSTPSARRATTAPCRPYTVPCHFYPRPPRGGRLRHCHRSGQGGGISIHALREEGDYTCASLVPTSRPFLSTPSARRATKSAGCPHGPVPFLSTPSARRATGWDVNESIAGLISIHALREEGDPAFVRA